MRKPPARLVMLRRSKSFVWISHGDTEAKEALDVRRWRPTGQKHPVRCFSGLGLGSRRYVSTEGTEFASWHGLKCRQINSCQLRLEMGRDPREAEDRSAPASMLCVTRCCKESTQRVDVQCNLQIGSLQHLKWCRCPGMASIV